MVLRNAKLEGFRFAGLHPHDFDIVDPLSTQDRLTPDLCSRYGRGCQETDGRCFETPHRRCAPAASRTNQQKPPSAANTYEGPQSAAPTREIATEPRGESAINETWGGTARL